MSQVWDDEGNVIPVTHIQAGPIVVTQVKTEEKDGYSAIQVGYQPTKKSLTKPLKGHLKDLGGFTYLREFHTDKEAKLGDTIDVSVFEKGDKVMVTGTDKGRGFQGVVKRHGFHGAPKSHGTKDQLRMPGSIGSTGPQRVIKGKKMAGRMGGTTKTIKNLKVVDIDPEKGLLFLKGAVPGNKKGVLLIEKR